MKNLSIEEKLFSDEPIRGSVILAINDLAAGGITYDEMTTSQICKMANVSRSTFYRHFEEKLEAVQWGMRRVSLVGIGSIGRTLDWHEGVTMTLEATKRLAPFFKAGGKWANKCYPIVTESFMRYHMDMFSTTITIYKRERLDEGLEAVLRFWVFSLTESLNWWRLNDFAPPVEEMTEYIIRAVPQEIYDLLSMQNSPR